MHKIPTVTNDFQFQPCCELNFLAIGTYVIQDTEFICWLVKIGFCLWFELFEQQQKKKYFDII